MPRQSRKRCNDQPCTSCRSRRRSRWIYWPCTVCVRALSGSARVWPIKSAGQQGGTVAEGPARVLHVSQLQPLHPPPASEVDDLLQVVEVVPVQDDVERDREPEPPSR